MVDIFSSMLGSRKKEKTNALDNPAPRRPPFDFGKPSREEDTWIFVSSESDEPASGASDSESGIIVSSGNKGKKPEVRPTFGDSDRESGDSDRESGDSDRESGALDREREIIVSSGNKGKELEFQLTFGDSDRERGDLDSESGIIVPGGKQGIWTKDKLRQYMNLDDNSTEPEGKGKASKGKQAVRPGKPETDTDRDSAYETDANSGNETEQDPKRVKSSWSFWRTREKPHKLRSPVQLETDTGTDGDSAYETDRDRDNKNDLQIASENVETQRASITSYVSSILEEAYTVAQKMMEDINWPRARPTQLDKNSGQDTTEERRDDTLVGKLRNRLESEYRNDLLGRVQYVSRYKEFDQAELNILRGDRAGAIRESESLLSKLRRRVVAYDSQPGRHAEDSDANKVSRDGKLEILEVDINGKRLARRKISFDHIESVTQGFITDAVQSPHAVDTYIMYKADLRREQYATKKARETGKDATSGEYIAALQKGEDEYDMAQKKAENAVRKLACLEKPLEEMKAIVSGDSKQNFGTRLNGLEGTLKNLLTLANKIDDEDPKNGNNVKKSIEDIHKKVRSIKKLSVNIIRKASLEEDIKNLSEQLQEASEINREDGPYEDLENKIKSLNDEISRKESELENIKEKTIKDLKSELEEPIKELNDEFQEQVKARKASPGNSSGDILSLLDEISRKESELENIKEKTIKDLKSELEETIKELSKKSENAKEEVNGAIEYFSGLRAEDKQITRLVTSARVAHSGAQDAEQELRMADKKFVEAKEEEARSLRENFGPSFVAKSGLVNNEKINQRRATLGEKQFDHAWWSNYSNRAWKDLHKKKRQESADISMETVREMYGEHRLVYGARRNGNVQVYSLKQGKSVPVYTGIEIPLERIAVGKDKDTGKRRTGTNEKGEFIIHFTDGDGTEATALNIPKVDDLEAAKRRVATNMLDANVRGMKAQIEGVLKILTTRDSKFDENAVRLILADIRRNDAFVEKTFALLSEPAAPQTEATRWRQIFEADRLRTMSPYQVEEKFSKNVLDMLTGLNDIREEFSRAAKKRAEEAIDQGEEKVAAEEMTKVERFRHPLREINPDFVGRDYVLYENAGRLLERVEVNEYSDVAHSENTLIKHLKETLKKSTNEVRDRIMQQSVIEAYFKHIGKADRRSAVCATLGQYDVRPAEADKIANELEQEMDERLKEWLASTITPHKGEILTIEKYLNLSPSKRSEMINRAATAYFQNDSDPRVREKVMHAAFRNIDERKAIHAAFKNSDDQRAKLLVPAMLKTFGRRSSTGLDKLKNYKWSEEAYERKAREIIKNTAETQRNSFYLRSSFYDTVHQLYFDRRSVLTGTLVERASDLIYDQSTYDYNSCKLAAKKNIAFFKGFLNSALPHEDVDHKVIFESVAAYPSRICIPSQDFARMIAKAHKLFEARSKEPEKAISDMFRSDSGGKISAEEARALARNLLAVAHEVDSGLWDVANAEYTHIHRRDMEKEEENAIKNKFSIPLSDRDPNHLYIDSYLANETGQAYNRYDPLNRLWKNRLIIDQIYFTSIKEGEKKSYDRILPLVGKLDTLDEEMLDTIPHEKEKELLRNAIRFQNQWVQNLTNIMKEWTKEPSSDVAGQDVRTVVEHTWHQVLKMDRDLKTVREALEEDMTSEQRRKIVDRVVVEMGKPLKTREELYEETMRPLTEKIQQLEEKAQKNFSAKNAETAGFIEWVTDIASFSAEISPLVMRKRLLDLHMRNAEDDFKGFAQTLHREMPLFRSSFEKFATEELARRHAIQVEDIKQHNIMEQKMLDQKHHMERIAVQKSMTKLQNFLSILILAGSNFNQSALLLNDALTRTTVNAFQKMR